MGWLSWLFPSDEDRVRKGERYLEHKEFALARDAVGEIDSPAAEAVRAQALHGLMMLNIDVAIGYARAGEVDRAQEHMELADQFGERGAPELKAARRAMREARAEARAAATPKASLGMAGGAFGGALAAPGGGPVGEELPPDADPLFSLPPEDPRVRFAMLLETWPEPLRLRMTELGPEFATASLAVEDGEAAHAVEVLTPFIERDPVARLQRSRAARLGGNLPLALSDLRAAVDALGHFHEGSLHTRAMLVEVLAESGKLDEALAEAEAGLAVERDDLALGSLKASLLEARQDWAGADEVARKLAMKHPRHMHLYRLMGRVRIRAGKRVEAMQVLEAGLTSNCTSGKCGCQPFDVEAGRMLAQLYLEDRVEPRRAEELVARIKANLRQPGWSEAYLDALVARNQNDPQLSGMVRGLTAGLHATDPRAQLVQQTFGAS